jgi:hypothetical protein
MNVPEIPSPRVAVLARDVAPGGRQVISEINAGELRALTAATGHEWAVVVQRDGQLALIHGTPVDVPLRNGDQLLVHTHPPGSTAMPSSPGNTMSPSGGSDTANAAYNAQHYGWDHPQAVVGQDGNVRFYDQNGVVSDPGSRMLPIDQNGNINGMHRPGGNPDTPMSAIPPAQMYPGYGPWL